MYAIIEVGARQYNVKKDDILDVSRQAAQEGKEISLNKVLLVSKDKKIHIGQPYLKDAKVGAVVVRHLKARKVFSYKYRRRKSTHWQKGHRQELTRIRIKDIDIAYVY